MKKLLVLALSLATLTATISSAQACNLRAGEYSLGMCPGGGGNSSNNEAWFQLNNHTSNTLYYGGGKKLRPKESVWIKGSLYKGSFTLWHKHSATNYESRKVRLKYKDGYTLKVGVQTKDNGSLIFYTYYE